MSYKVWTLEESDSTRADLEVYHAPCVGRDCIGCYANRTLYKVCPGCGGKLLVETTLPYMCSYGTVIWTCGLPDGKFVIIYAVSSLLLEIEEDTI